MTQFALDLRGYGGLSTYFQGLDYNGTSPKITVAYRGKRDHCAKHVVCIPRLNSYVCWKGKRVGELDR